MSQEDIAAGLAAKKPTDRTNRRRDSIAGTYKPDPKMDAMRRLLDDDPQKFEATYGARGHITLGFYEAAQRAAEGLDDPDEAA